MKVHKTWDKGSDESLRLPPGSPFRASLSPPRPLPPPVPITLLTLAIFCVVYLFWEAFPALCTQPQPPPHSQLVFPRSSVGFNICCQEFILFKGKRDSQRSLSASPIRGVTHPTRLPSPALCFLFWPQYYCETIVRQVNGLQFLALKIFIWKYLSWMLTFSY